MQAALRGGQGCSLCWQPNSVTCKSLGATGFEGTKGSWRKAETWYCERPGEAIGEGTAGLIMEAPGLKGSWRTAETLDHEEIPIEGQPSYSRRLQLFGDGSAMGLLSSKRAAVEWGMTQTEKTNCVFSRGKGWRSDPGSLEEPRVL